MGCMGKSTQLRAKSQLGIDKQAVSEKIRKEVIQIRIPCSFAKPPFLNYTCSQLGLLLKADGKFLPIR